MSVYFSHEHPAAKLHEFHAEDRFKGDYLYACLGFRF
jgi:hypothetical protein